MHEHDLDLIAALAGSSLDDESEARALVDSCDVCRSEYRSQTEVLAWIASAPRVEMTELEKAALHRDLWTEFRREPARAGSTPWWQQWSYVAAGLFVAVGLVSVLNGALGTGGEAGDTMAETRSDLDAAAPSNDEAVPFIAGDSGTDSGLESDGATTTAATEGSLPLPFPELAEEARASRQADPGMGTMSVDSAVEKCLTRIGLDDHIVVQEIEHDQTYLAVMAEDQGADRSVTFVTLTDCEIVYVDR
jgi:hypothetical protein